jgi:hypothetical protein
MGIRGTIRYGAGMLLMTCEGTEMTRRGVAGTGSRSEGCRGAEHGQTCTKDRTGAMAGAMA